ncbi:LutC/YkgG family protein [Hufsiella ginkgonis]|uniref:Lactate utilization protein B/C n=1 Tax=Hufsiella ginkgonis TaxID=2695274 RepID=A0A7K1Y3L8_9SPHI|nr:LUD domain-containing protein [Hufsiella ginkgonis]MXV17884.1 lactate utilization protein B/C [Hufsiella ginkgonis]
MSREKILAAVAANQPASQPLPPDPGMNFPAGDLVEKFAAVVTAIGARVVGIGSVAEIPARIAELFQGGRIVSFIPELAEIAENDISPATDPHTLENVDVTILQPHFAVAENGACWITEDLMGHRVLPFITQHLAMVVTAEQIVPTMHQAYDRIAEGAYGFAAFIAGPSKTADIEQSLVLGAHGPRSMTIFLVGL